MVRKIGVAVLLGMLSVVALSTTAGAQCGTGPSIILNTASFAYETGVPVGAPYVSSPGNGLTMVGLVQAFCSPFSDLNVSAASDTQYTVVLESMISGGTTHPTPDIWVTNYYGGQVEIYQNSPPTAPTDAASMPPSANLGIPGIYRLGTLLLRGNLSGFNITVVQTPGGQPNGGWTCSATYTGGLLYPRVTGSGPIVIQGNYCVVPGCLPPAPGWNAQLDGKFDQAVTPTHASTWGQIKLLYR